MISARVTLLDYIKAAQDLNVRIVTESIEPGDLYLAGRNTGIHLLTCLKNNKKGAWIVPIEDAYCYDTWECKKIVEDM